MNARLLLLIVIVASANAACTRTKDDRLFAPKGCDYAATFPVAPLIEAMPEPVPGSANTKAETPAGHSPWVMAQCTAMPTGTGSVTAGVLEAQDRANLEQMHAQHITSSSTQDARGNMTKTVGEIMSGSKAMVFTQFTIVGPRSTLYVSTLESAQGSPSVKEEFFAHIVRKSY